jgi:hypothetical protein
MENATISIADEAVLAYHVLRYAPDLVRDEWVNIGVMVFDPRTGALRLRLIEGQDEYARVRRLQPTTDEGMLRKLRDHLEDRFTVYLRNARVERGETVQPGEELTRMVDAWNQTLSNGLQLAPQKGVHADDIEKETDRLYAEHVAPRRKPHRVGAAGSRAEVRSYCSQVFRQAQIWERLERAVRVSDYTFAGDPMRVDYSYRRNGTRGFVQTLSVSRAPADAKLFAYTAERIAAKASLKTEFTAVTDVALDSGNDRHRFVRDTLREVGIEPVAMEGFAVWVAKLKPLMLQ